MPWLLGGGALIAILLASKTAAAPTAKPLVTAPHAPARVAPAWRITKPKALYGWVNYFTGSNYSASDTVHPQDYADMIHNACATAASSDISLLRTLASDLQSIQSIPLSVSPHGGIQGMSVAQAKNYQNQVLSCIARLQSAPRVPRTSTVRAPAAYAIGITPHAPAHPSSSAPSYVYSPASGGGGGGGGGLPSIPGGSGGGGGGGGAEGTGGSGYASGDSTSGTPDPTATDLGNVDSGSFMSETELS